MDVRLPDGTIVTNVPEGTTQSDLMARVNRMSRSDFAAIKKEGNIPPDSMTRAMAEAAAIQNVSGAELLAGNPLTRFAVGMGEPFLGIGQTIEKRIGGNELSDTLAQYKDIEERGRKALGSEGFDWIKTAGNVASPAIVAPIKAMPPTKTALGRVGQGTAVGAGAGAAMPVYGGDYAEQKATQVGGGALAGAAVPLGWEASKTVGRGIRNVAQPYMGEWGRDQAAGRLANVVAGDKRSAILRALENPQTFTPGFRPTAGQASVPANSAEFAALQAIGEETMPSKFVGAQGVEGQQKSALLAALRNVGKTPVEVRNAQDIRRLSAEQNYGAVAKDVVVPATPEIKEILSRPSMKSAIARARELAKENKVPFPKNLQGGITVENLQFVKMGMDDLTANPERFGIGASEVRAIGNTQKEFVKWLEQESPGWARARDVYKNQSVPINRMEVGQELEKRLTPALTQDANLRATVYANALREAPQTIKKATGQPRYEALDQLMTPNEMQAIQGVHSELARDAAYNSLAKSGAPAAREAIGMAVPKAPAQGFFNPYVSAGRAAYNAFTGKATEKILRDFAAHSDNPQKIAEMMRKAEPMKRQVLVDMLMRYSGAAPPIVNQQQGSQ